MSGQSPVVHTRWGAVTPTEAALLRLAAAMVTARDALRNEPDAADVVEGTRKLDIAVTSALQRIGGRVR